MGTTWSVVLAAPPGPITLDSLHNAIEGELVRINQLMSTYQADSELSIFNANTSTELLRLNAEILFVLDASIKISDASDGAYDVTLGAVIDVWGFGASEQQRASPTKQRLKQAADATGYNRIIRDGTKIGKPNAQMRIDLSSLAKGYAVDRIGFIVERAGLHDYLAEIGGEVRARGSRAKGKPWRVGIEIPNGEVAQGITMTDVSIASSGSYRNYREIDGKRVSHLINGQTYKPISHNTVAATVLHRNTMLADAWATALMVVSPDKARTLIYEHDIEAQLTYKTDKGFATWRTPGFTALLIDNPDVAGF
ncbi:MAG: FAD:protein FMN transferase [Granulosicoccaceae bacterium]